MDAKLEKILAALAKADPTKTTQEEADVAEAYAHRLMIKYGIEQAQVDAARIASGGRPENVVERRITVRGIYSAGLLSLGHSVARGLGLRSLQANGWQGSDRYLYVVGFESDVELFEVIFTSLQLQALGAMRAFWRRHPMSSVADKMYRFKECRQFVRSFGHQVERRLLAARRTGVEEAGTGTELVLASRESRLDAAFKTMYPETRSATDRSQLGSLMSMREGRAAGDRADVGTRRVGGTTTGTRQLT